MELFDEAALHFSGASALIIVLQNSIEAVILEHHEKASLIGGIIVLLKDGYQCLKTAECSDWTPIIGLVEQVTVGLTCLQCAFLNETSCPNNRLQIESVHALGYLLQQAIRRFVSLI
jgi:c-di-GMP-related signal transduction protein